jgi:hypothetical protein
MDCSSPNNRVCRAEWANLIDLETRKVPSVKHGETAKARPPSENEDQGLFQPISRDGFSSKLALCVARVNCNYVFSTGNGFGNRKWYQELKLGGADLYQFHGESSTH